MFKNNFCKLGGLPLKIGSPNIKTYMQEPQQCRVCYNLTEVKCAAGLGWYIFFVITIVLLYYLL